MKNNKTNKKITLDDLAIMIAVGFRNVDKRFQSVDERFESVDKKFDAIDRKFDIVGARFNDMEDHFDGVENRLTNIEKLFIKNNEEHHIIRTKIAILERAKH